VVYHLVASRHRAADRAVAKAAAALLALTLIACQGAAQLPSTSGNEPTTSAAATATLEPTAVPTAGVTTWTGLDWALGNTAQGSCWGINDIKPWGDGYVGVGSSRQGLAGNCIPTSSLAPAFFMSADGLHWTIAQEGAPIANDDQSAEDLLPTYLVPVGDTLLAIGRTPVGTGAPVLWSSEDGSTWTLLHNASWRDALTKNTLLSVAAGPAGVVGVGAVGNMCCANPQGPPLIIHSADGVTWDRLDLSSVFDRAYFTDVTAYPGGFAIVGRVGEKQVLGGEPAVGKPAAWASRDGVTWLAAEVEGSEAPDASLFTVVAGADGLFATGYTTEFTSWQAPRSGWASADGRSWRLVGKMGTDLPLAIDLPGAIGFPADVAGDSAHMVMFGRESCKTTELIAWTSLDGVKWTQLAFSGATASLPTIAGPICNDDGTEGSNVGSLGLANAFVTPGGVFVMASSSAPVAPTYWFLTATTR
jgi:hypothetical protein